MKANIRKIEYMVVQPHTYLVAELEPGARTVGFCLEMAERCRIPGLLPLHRQMVDGGVRLCYDITGKKRLADLAAEMSLSEDGVLRLVRNLLEGLAGLPEYFLRTTQCLLEEDYTYADSTLAVYLPLAPMEDDPADGDALLRDYLIRLLGSCTSAGRTGPRLNELAACLIRPDFSVPGLLDKVRALSAGQKLLIALAVVVARVEEVFHVVGHHAVAAVFGQQAGRGREHREQHSRQPIHGGRGRP